MRIQFEVQTFERGVNGECSAHVELGGETMCEIGYGDIKKVVKRLQHNVGVLISWAIKRDRNSRQCIVGTNEGTILILQWRTTGWEILTAGPGRDGHGYYIGNKWKTYDEAHAGLLEYAKNFDGVKWEC